jgi:hypothetical protein
VPEAGAGKTQEQFQFYFRQHWIRLVRPMFRMLIASVIAGLIAHFGLPAVYGPDDEGKHLILTFIFVFFVIVQADFLIRFYRYFLNVVVVTDKRVHRTKKYLMSLDNHESVDWQSIQEIHKVQRGVVQNMFGFGTLVLEAQETEIRLHFVPKINRIYERITRLREQAR